MALNKVSFQAILTSQEGGKNHSKNYNVVNLNFFMKHRHQINFSPSRTKLNSFSHSPVESGSVCWLDTAE